MECKNMMLTFDSAFQVTQRTRYEIYKFVVPQNLLKKDDPHGSMTFLCQDTEMCKSDNKSQPMFIIL